MTALYRNDTVPPEEMERALAQLSTEDRKLYDRDMKTFGKAAIEAYEDFATNCVRFRYAPVAAFVELKR